MIPSKNTKPFTSTKHKALYIMAQYFLIFRVARKNIKRKTTGFFFHQQMILYSCKDDKYLLTNKKKLFFFVWHSEFITVSVSDNETKKITNVHVFCIFIVVVFLLLRQIWSFPSINNQQFDVTKGKESTRLNRIQ